MAHSLLMVSKLSKRQKEMLVNEMMESIQLLEGKSKNPEGSRAKKAAWHKLAEKLNSLGGPKTVAQWSKCWRDIRASVKKKVIRIHSQRCTGLTDPMRKRETLTGEEKKILLACGTQYFDSDSVTSEDAQANTLPIQDIATEEADLNLKEEIMSGDEEEEQILPESSAIDDDYCLHKENTAFVPVIDANSIGKKLEKIPPAENQEESEVLTELRNISAFQKTTLNEIQKQTKLLEKMCAIMSSQIHNSHAK